jgi:hypothetical protein
MLSLERLKLLLNYDPLTGVFKWLVSTATNVKVGAVAGSDSHGYLAIRIDGKRYLAHRLAWFYMHGNWPPSMIDHIDGCKSNNCLSNLRAVENGGNMQNKKVAHGNSKTGLIGVSPYKKTGKFKAQIGVNGKVRHIGYFDTPEEAHAAYLAEKRKLHECCTI